MVGAKAVAAALDCSLPQAYADAAAGLLPHSRFESRLRFPVDGINDYLRDHKVA
jgi:hypothetical protein